MAFSDRGAHGSTNCRPKHSALGGAFLGDLRRCAAAHLEVRKLAADRIVRLKLLETLPVTGQHQHAGADGNSGTTAENSRRKDGDSGQSPVHGSIQESGGWGTTLSQPWGQLWTWG